ncbi:MAG TPA: ribosome silencing factor [Rickettsiales bacterium]|nr:ribosome silencing factor [Rickettsiales bacterium]
MPKLELKNVVIKNLEEQKIEDLICIDTSRISSLADYVIIGSGRSNKHLESTIENLKTFLKHKYEISGQINGSEGWFAFDLGNIIVHLFEPKVRKLYKLETLFESRIKKADKLEAKKKEKVIKKPVAKKVIKKTKK